MKLQSVNVFNRLKNHPKLQSLSAIIKSVIKEKIPGLQSFWIKLTNREKLLLGVMSVSILIFILVTIISAAIGFADSLKSSYTMLQTDRIKVTSMNKTYTSLLKTSGNEFSPVKLERIKEDITQILNIKTPDATMQDGVLIIKVDNITFESSMLFLDQMRKSYGLFPEKLVITTAFNPGFIAFRATFKVEEE